MHSVLLICGLLLTELLLPVCSKAMDPRFELSPQTIKKVTSADATSGKPVKRAAQSVKKARLNRVTSAKAGAAAQTLRLMHSETPSLSAAPMPKNLRATWERLAPIASTPPKPLSFQTDLFSLTIDPSRYPQLTSMDGATILLDPQETLPPLVRTLIQEKDASVRIVSVSPADRRRFLSELLAAGSFYSVEEAFVMEFGKDPRLTVRSDFKVERAADSLVKQELALVNAGQVGSSPRLSDFLQREGIQVLEPFAVEPSTPVAPLHKVFRFSPKGQGELIDSLLGALAIPYERNRRVELFSAAESGVGLSVQADRLFERNGRRYVVSRFAGDPVAYTLLRLLETKGYRVVILDAKDDFRSLSDKLLARLELPASYAPQLLVNRPSVNYSLELSGYLLENAAPGGGAVMLTDRPLDPIIRELLAEQGYQVQER